MTAQLAEGSAVWFDTNAYRDVADDEIPVALIKTIRDAEKRADVQPVSQPIVLWELLANLSGGATASTRWVDAVRAAVLHCWMGDSDGGGIATLADPESLICMALYDREPDGHAAITTRMHELATAILRDPDWHQYKPIRDHLKVLAQMNRQTESQFVGDLWTYVVKTVDPSATPGDWGPVRNDPQTRSKALAFVRSDDGRLELAVNLAQMAQDLLKISESTTATKQKARWIQKRFATAIQLYGAILERIITTGCNLDKPHRRNWVWDLRIALCVGPSHTTRGRRMLLVTGDRDILTAAEASAAADCVIGLRQYLRVLGAAADG